MTGRIAVMSLTALLAMSPSPARPDEERTLSGNVTYPHRIALPSDASLSVRLEEEPKPDASRRTIAEATIPTDGRQVPIPFALGYDPARIDRAKRYTVRATISASGKTLFRTAAAYPVLTRGAPERVTIVLEPAEGRRRRPHATPTSTPPPDATPAEASPTAPPASSPSRSPRSSGRTARG